MIAMVRSVSLLSTDDIADADVTIFLNEGQRRLAGALDWPWLKAVDDTLTIASPATASFLPADFARARALVIEDEDTKLAEISDQEAWERWGDDIPTGSARVWWLSSTSAPNLNIAPSPSGTTNLKLYYWKAPTDLSAGGDTPVFASQFHGVLVDWALHRVWQREEDYTKAGRHEEWYNRTLNDMARFYFNQSQDHPMVFGESSDYSQRRRGNDNLPFLNGA